MAPSDWHRAVTLGRLRKRATRVGGLPFLIGERYEDLAVVTESEYRGLGLSATCAAAVCCDIFDRGRQPGWSAQSQNLASLRVAEKLGFLMQRRDRLFVAGMWTESLHQAKLELARLIPVGSSFILVDECQWGAEILTGCRAIPFLEHEGETGDNRPMTDRNPRTGAFAAVWGYVYRRCVAGFLVVRPLCWVAGSPEFFSLPAEKRQGRGIDLKQCNEASR